MQQQNEVMRDVDLRSEHLRELVRRFKLVYEDHGERFPQDPYEQLHCAIIAALKTWKSEHAMHYRSVNGMADLNGLAIHVQVLP
jgi:pyruvate, orthophosphate dikinase